MNLKPQRQRQRFLVVAEHCRCHRRRYWERNKQKKPKI